MAHNLDTHIIAAFERQDNAEAAVRALRRAGFGDDQIGILRRQDVTQWHQKGDSGEVISEGVAAGAAAGSAIGVAAGVAVVAGLIPGIGPAIAGGILGGILGSAGIGAAAGGLIGGLIGLGLSEDEAHYYEAEVRHGSTIVTVRPEGRILEARDILFRQGAYDRPVAATPY